MNLTVLTTSVYIHLRVPKAGFVHASALEALTSKCVHHSAIEIKNAPEKIIAAPENRIILCCSFSR